MKISPKVSDVATTVFGFILSAMIMTNVDYTKLLSLDKAEFAKIIGAAVLIANGWLTNKTKSDEGKPKV